MAMVRTASTTKGVENKGTAQQFAMLVLLWVSVIEFVRLVQLSMAFLDALARTPPMRQKR
jgi:hypothetical protein